jgi:Clp amino terminal domain, pathogenicity island component
MTLIALGWQEARRLGHHWVGEEHMLLALSRDSGTAGEVLRRAGARPEAIEAVLLQALEGREPSTEPGAVESPAFNPAYYSALGCADGLALAAGRNEAMPEDILVALVWRPRLASSILHRLGVDRGALIDDLAARGVPVPAGEPEPLDLRPKKRVDIPFEHLTTIVSEVPRRLPEGSSFGFNLDPKTSRAWIFVDEELDAEPLVAAILERQGDSHG